MVTLVPEILFIGSSMITLWKVEVDKDIGPTSRWAELLTWKIETWYFDCHHHFYSNNENDVESWLCVKSQKLDYQ